MPLLSEVEYESGIENFKNISPQRVLLMIKDVRVKIGKLESTFKTLHLKTVLGIIERGVYEIDGDVQTRINLSSAKSVIDAYRRYSEGGCQSCVSLGRETIDAEDATSGWYCEVDDPDYDANAIGDRLGVRYEGFSPKVKKHYKNPCSVWKPRFSPKLDELVKRE